MTGECLTMYNIIVVWFLAEMKCTPLVRRYEIQSDEQGAFFVFATFRRLRWGGMGLWAAPLSRRPSFHKFVPSPLHFRILHDHVRQAGLRRLLNIGKVKKAGILRIAGEGLCADLQLLGTPVEVRGFISGLPAEEYVAADPSDAGAVKPITDMGICPQLRNGRIVAIGIAEDVNADIETGEFTFCSGEAEEGIFSPRKIGDAVIEEVGGEKRRQSGKRTHADAEISAHHLCGRYRFVRPL